MLNSPFLKRIVEEINTKKPGTIEIVEEKKSSNVLLQFAAVTADRLITSSFFSLSKF